MVEAIDKNDIELLKEELGDVLLQVVFTRRWKRKTIILPLMMWRMEFVKS